MSIVKLAGVEPYEILLSSVLGLADAVDGLLIGSNSNKLRFSDASFDAPLIGDMNVLILAISRSRVCVFLLGL